MRVRVKCISNQARGVLFAVLVGLLFSFGFVGSKAAFANSELNRPEYHITPQAEWMNDVQRPLYINGQHHLYYLYNDDYSWGGNGTEWAHAVSTDLVHWERKPVAIEKYKTPYGDPWTGSTVIDENNTAGFGKNAVIALVTMPYEGQSTHLWYSTDGGNSFKHYNIVQHNPTGSADFRDPKIIWHEQTQKWVMLLAERDKVGFYTSSNLKDWEYTSSFVRQDIGIIECPDIFQLNVDGNSDNKKWVLMIGGNGFNYGVTTGSSYFVGDFDGREFHAETPVKWLEQGADSYTGVTWDAPYTNGNFRYFISWMNNWNYAGKLPWDTFNGNTSIVREIRLKTTPDGLKLVQEPVWNLLDNFPIIMDIRGEDIYTGQENIFKDFHGLSYSIEAQIDVADLTEGKFGFSVRDGDGQHADLTYDKSINEFVFNRESSRIKIDVEEFKRPQRVIVAPKEGKIKLEILVDRNAVEVFINDGEYVLSNLILNDLSSDGLRLWTDGHLHLDYLKLRDSNEFTIS
ncbi:levanbiose-producing levanase [Paenibacillus sophorae]|uniref:Glycoside hydrolase family 32 protein n=1 Tax=Paenibacillus sophorae TaxID=1333845 RepID=A0A1H8IJ43_9BACL|nr:glycoside hydrolase family 32 protein [Paenibacillus sophorae]QWU15993.1 glycoside hydrolase family 32 protein [Paenibacillus sophorae]SEN68890.1 levanbiose-producing levanase [Paenibacillus sophorae]